MSSSGNTSVKADRSAEFEKIYGENGAWVKLFQNGSGYLGTELLLDSKAALSVPDNRSLGFEVDYETFLSS